MFKLKFTEFNSTFLSFCTLKCRICVSLLPVCHWADGQRRSAVTAVCGWFSSHFIMWHLSLSLACFCAQTLGLVLLAARHTVTTQWNITRSLWDRAQPNLRRLCPGNDCDDHRVRSRCYSLCCHHYILSAIMEEITIYHLRVIYYKCYFSKSADVSSTTCSQSIRSKSSCSVVKYV